MSKKLSNLCGLLCDNFCDGGELWKKPDRIKTNPASAFTVGTGFSMLFKSKI